MVAAANQTAPSYGTDVEAGTKQQSSVTYNGAVYKMHDYAELKDRWQAANMVEPYLDTADPKFSWFHTASHKNIVSSEVKPS